MRVGISILVPDSTVVCDLGLTQKIPTLAMYMIVIKYRFALHVLVRIVKQNRNVCAAKHDEIKVIAAQVYCIVEGAAQLSASAIPEISSEL